MALAGSQKEKENEAVINFSGVTPHTEKAARHCCTLKMMRGRRGGHVKMAHLEILVG